MFLRLQEHVVDSVRKAFSIFKHALERYCRVHVRCVVMKCHFAKQMFRSNSMSFICALMCEIHMIQNGILALHLIFYANVNRCINHIIYAY